MVEPIIWSPTRLDRALTCMRMYYYAYIKPEKVPIVPAIALGIFMHRRPELFYDESGKPRYKSADSFANSSVATWKRYVAKNSRIRGQEIKWDFEGQKWALCNDISDICHNLYRRYSEEEPPILMEFKPPVIKVDNMYFTGRFDEIRKGLIIRDHKSGWYRPTELELNHDPQFTIYVLMLATLAHFHEGFAQLIGVPKRLANTWAGNPVYLPAEVAIEHYHMRSDKITPTHRLDVQLEDLMKTVIDLSGRIAKGDFPTNRRSCRKCLWSEACDRDTFGIYPKGYTPQVELFGKPDLPRKIEVEQTKLEFPRIKSR